MKNIIPILFIFLPITLFSQNSLETAAVRDRIETAVDQGLITREQADKRYAKYKEKLRRGHDLNQNKPEKNTELVAHFKKLGINNLNRIKKDLMNNGISENQLDAVLGGMIRLIHGAKAKKNNPQISMRMKTYFQDKIGLNPKQIEYVMAISARIAQRVK